MKDCARFLLHMQLWEDAAPHKSEKAKYKEQISHDVDTGAPDNLIQGVDILITVDMIRHLNNLWKKCFGKKKGKQVHETKV